MMHSQKDTLDVIINTVCAIAMLNFYIYCHVICIVLIVPMRIELSTGREAAEN